MRQEIIVETKGQLMAAVLALNKHVPTTIILKRKTGITVIEQNWNGSSCVPMGEIRRIIRARIKRLPAKELLA